MTLLQVSQCGKALSIRAAAGDRLLPAIWLSGKIRTMPVCAGLSHCGRCRVRFSIHAPEPVPEDEQALSPEELGDGWRLACHHFVPDAPRVELELPEIARQYHANEHRDFKGRAFIGIDLGTTTIQWRTISEEGSPVSEGSMPNPQAGAGADVVSRLATAMNETGKKALRALALDAIYSIINSAAKNGADIARISIAANSAMTAILLGKDIAGLCSAPYKLPWRGGETLNLQLGKHELAAVFPPLPGPFVGGDISAGLLALLHNKQKLPFLLIDLGTNAEMALVLDKDALYLASAPLGPAMEGIGPGCGQQAGPGVITAFYLTADGLHSRLYGDIHSDRHTGISAIGYLSLLALLLKLEIISPEGHFNKKAPHPLAGRILQRLSDDKLDLGGGLYLTESDIEVLLKVKAACEMALHSLLSAAQLPASAIAGVALAGALGQYADPLDLTVLGFLPSVLASRCLSAGNTALDGACLLAKDPALNTTLKEICSKAVIISQGDGAEYARGYIACMRWGSNEI